MSAKKTLQELVSDKYEIADNGCWLWTKYVNPSGYGQVQVSHKSKSAHRVMFQVHNGEIPKSLVVMHICDNKLCVNPDHLSLGTQKDNVRDCVAKGRARGLFGQAGKVSTSIRDFATGRYTPARVVKAA